MWLLKNNMVYSIKQYFFLSFIISVNVYNIYCLFTVNDTPLQCLINLFLFGSSYFYFKRVEKILAFYKSVAVYDIINNTSFHKNLPKFFNLIWSFKKVSMSNLVELHTKK